MKVVKELDQYNKEVIKIINDNGSAFLMHFGGADFYWTMSDYYDGNQFIIDKNNPLFKPLSKVFKIIRRKDVKWEQTLKNNSFEWISEAAGLLEDKSKLCITDNSESFSVQFVRNPKDVYGHITNICSISFCMSGSRNPDIAYAFSNMFVQLSMVLDTPHKKKKLG